MTKEEYYQIRDSVYENAGMDKFDFDLMMCRVVMKAVEVERKKWEPVIAGVMREVPWQLKSSKKGNAPGHAHEVVGIWDSDNGELAGTQCAWCKAWNTALNIIEERKQS